MIEYAALITNAIVEQIIVGNYVWANENLVGDWVDCSNGGQLVVGIGWAYDAETGDFTQPDPLIEQ